MCCRFSVLYFHFYRVRLEKAKLLNTAYRITALNEQQLQRQQQRQQQQQKQPQQQQQKMAIPISFEHQQHDTNTNIGNYLKDHLSAVDYHDVRYLNAQQLKRNKTATCQPRQLLIDKVREYLHAPQRSE